jgi:hypothetical protein
MKVWKITAVGFSSYYESNYKIIPELLEDMSTGDKFIIDCVDMDEEKYNALSEFTGF